MRRRVGVAAFLGVLAGGLAPALPASGQTPAAPGDTLVLGLSQAVAVAQRSNPAFLRAENQLWLNEPQSRATWLGQVVPQLSVDLFNTGYAGQLTRQFVDFVGNPVDNPNASWVYSSSTRQGVDLTWSIQGLSFLNAGRRQARTNRGRELEVAVARAELEADVRRQYFDALEQQELLEVEVALLAAREVDRESAERLFRIGQSSRVDVLNAELAIEQQNLAIQRQRRAHEQAVLTLRTALGDPDLPALRLAPEDLPLFEPSALDDGALVSRALRDNPSIRSGQAAVSGSQVGLDEAREWRWPTLNLNYSWGRFVRGRNDQALGDLGYDPNDIQSQFSASLSFPFLNDYFGRRADEAQARVELQNSRESLKEERLRVEQEVRSQLINLRNQHETLRVARRSLEIAAEALRLAREEYRIGTRTFEQLQEAVRQEADARRQVIEARFGFVDALVALERAVGGRVAPGFGSASAVGVPPALAPGGPGPAPAYGPAGR